MDILRIKTSFMIYMIHGNYNNICENNRFLPHNIYILYNIYVLVNVCKDDVLYIMYKSGIIFLFCSVLFFMSYRSFTANVNGVVQPVKA